VSLNQSPGPPEFDVVIAGGGPAGSAAAIHLARAGRRVCLLEAGEAPRQKIGETLPPEARQPLCDLQLWERFRARGHLPSHGNRSAWGSDVLDERDFIFHPQGSAWQLDRRQFEVLLVQGAIEAGATVYHGESLSHCERMSGSWRLRTNSRSLEAAWLIDATGRRSLVARLNGVRRIVSDELVAIHAIAPLGRIRDEDSRTFLEARSEGWWYTALVPDGRRVISYQTDADLLHGQEWRTREWFEARLRDTLHLGPFLEAHDRRITSAPRLTSAHSGRLEQFCGDGWLAVGDATLSFDPLSGQGMLKALLSAQRAAQAIAAGGSEALETYAHWNANIWEQYLTSRHAYYQAEERWPECPFWKRRRNRQQEASIVR